MMNLAIFVALGWFWLTFYSVGPLTSWTQVAVGTVSLLLSCLASALWGRRKPCGAARVEP